MHTRTSLTLVAVAALLVGAAYAADEPTPPKGGPGAHAMGAGPGRVPMEHKSRKDTIESLKKRIAQLEKMSDEEWEKMHKRRGEQFQKFKNMSPDQREKMRDGMRERLMQKQSEGQ